MTSHGGFGGTILSSPLFIEMILPFLLVFAVVFAILQKTKILGDGKRQIDAIVAAVIGLIVIAFAQAVDIIIYLMPVLAVSVVVLLVFMVISGMAFQEGTFELPKGVRWGIMALAGIVVIIALLVFTGQWGKIVDYFTVGDDYGIVTNVIFIGIIIAAVVIVVLPGKKPKAGKENKEGEE